MRSLGGVDNGPAISTAGVALLDSVGAAAMNADADERASTRDERWREHIPGITAGARLRYGLRWLPDLAIGAVVVTLAGDNFGVLPVGSERRRLFDADSVARRCRVSIDVTIGLPAASSVRVRDYGQVKVRRDSVRLTVPTRAVVDLADGWRCVGFSGEKKVSEALWLRVERERSVLCLQAPLSHLCLVAYAAGMAYVSPFDPVP